MFSSKTKKRHIFIFENFNLGQKKKKCENLSTVFKKFVTNIASLTRSVTDSLIVCFVLLNVERRRFLIFWPIPVCLLTVALKRKKFMEVKE